MAVLDEEMRLDAQEDAQAIAYIRQQLPAELQDVYTESLLQSLIDILVDLLANSDILDNEADEEGFVEIDMEHLSSVVVSEAASAGLGTLSADDILLVVQAWMDFEEQEAQNE